MGVLATKLVPSTVGGRMKLESERILSIHCSALELGGH